MPGIPGLTVLDCPDYAHNKANIPLDVTQNRTLGVVQAVLGDLAGEGRGVFQDRFLHVGGDEVVFGCWEESPTVSAFMRANGFVNGQQLENWWEQQLLEHVATSIDRRPVVWNEIFENHNKLPDGTVVQCWQNNSLLVDVVAAGTVHTRDALFLTAGRLGLLHPPAF